MSQLDTLLQARRSGRQQQGSSWSAGGRGILVIAALNIVLLWGVTGAVLWQIHRDEVTDWKRVAVNLSLTTTAYVQQTLVATDLMLRSMLDWVAEADIQSDAEFADPMKQPRFREAMRDRLAGLPQASIASIYSKEGHLLSSSADGSAPTHIGEHETFRAQVGPDSPPISISRSLPDANAKRWTFYLARRITAKTGQLLGVAIVGVEANYFADLFRQILLDDDSSVSLFRSDGALLATTLSKPGLMGGIYADAAPVRMIREGLSEIGRAHV